MGWLMGFLLCAFSVLSAAAPPQESGTSAIVEGFQATLLKVMKQGKQLGYEGRYAQLAPAVKASHDMRIITQIATGRYWDRLSDEQKDRLVEAFGRLGIATYASEFASYSGETFKTISEDRTAQGDAVVHTVLTDSNGEETHLDYILHQTEGGWRIINVIANGVSDLAMRRAEFTSILRSKGFDALIAKLEQKISQYSLGQGQS